MFTNLAAGSAMATGLANFLLATLGTFAGVIVAFVAFGHLFQRQVSKFIQFLGLALFIFLVAFHGLVIAGATELAHALGV